MEVCYWYWCFTIHWSFVTRIPSFGLLVVYLHLGVEASAELEIGDTKKRGESCYREEDSAGFEIEHSSVDWTCQGNNENEEDATTIEDSKYRCKLISLEPVFDVCIML